MANTAAEPPPAAQKPIHSLCIDAGPLIKNDPTVSSLLARATEIYTLPSVLAELRDEATRHRVQTTLRPFLKLRTPRPASVSFITGFARRTGDLEVLSRPDIHLLALTYEIECERNGGDGRLRREPVRGGAAPAGARPGPGSDGARADGELVPSEPSAGQSLESGGETTSAEATAGVELRTDSRQAERIEIGVEELSLVDGEATETVKAAEEASAEPPLPEPPSQEPPEKGSSQEPPPAELSEETLDKASVHEQEAEDSDPEEADEDSDGGWITPSNIHRHKAADAAGPPASSTATEETMQAAILTSDYAMQNVALRIGLHLVSPALMRVTHLKTWCLRCHGCFKTTRDMTRQFCPSCGQPTLTRTSCSVDADGRFTVHLKRNFQYNKRGNVYSIPKPVHGSASGKVADHGGGGGQGGWGKGLILAEDQKEFVRAKEAKKREKARDLFDQDYLPDILTGQRAGGGGGKIKVGAGRSVNSRRRR